MARQTCTAKAKSTGERCRRWPVKGYTVCRVHGANPGRTGAERRKGNKNAVTTGEHETILIDTLTERERELFGEISVEVARLIDDDLRIITIRERRMMERIKRLAGEDMAVVERIEEGHPSGEPIVTERSESTMAQIQNIEEALTRVQREKARLIDLKHKVESGKGVETVDINAYLVALGKTAEDVWEKAGDEDAAN